VRRATASIQRRGIPSRIIAVTALLALTALVLAGLLPSTATAWPIAGADSSREIASLANAERLQGLTRPFTIAVIPDTQVYTDRGMPEFEKQIEWVLAHAAEKNIVFVTHMGDVVDDGRVQAQWDNALDALGPLLAQNRLPFSIVRGNHDDPEYLLKNVPLFLTKRKPWFVAASPSGLSQAQKFQVKGVWFLHIGLEHNPTEEELGWANDLLREPALRGMPVIVSIHRYLDEDGKAPVGQRVWDSFIKDNPQVFMVLCGHAALERAFVSYNTAGLPVYEVLSDYQQYRPFGGNGLMRLITIDPVNDTIEVETFSPYFRYKSGRETDTDYYETDRDSQFAFSLSGSGLDLNERLAYNAGSDTGIRLLALSLAASRGTSGAFQ
jgi:predicted phosphodiesterase